MPGFSQNISLLILFGFIVIQIIFATVLGKILLKFATNLGVRNHGDGMVRWTSTTKPSLGGILFFFSFLLSIVFYLVILSENTKFNNLEFLGMVICCTLGFVMGLADDAYNTKPWLKFFVQVLCGVIAIACGTYVRIFPYEPVNYFVTIFWFVGLMNSLNMLDNMDGITASVTTVACVFLLLMNRISHDLFSYDNVLLLGVTGSLLAFLAYNWHPSKMYMGDSGSQFLGAFMAYLGIKLLWNVELPVSSAHTDVFMILLPVAFFIVTISDTATVSINRLMKRRSPFVGGKDHTTHHLVYGGFKQRSVAILYIAISVLGCLLGALMLKFELYTSWWALLTMAIILIVIFLSLFMVTKKFKNESA